MGCPFFHAKCRERKVSALPIIRIAHPPASRAAGHALRLREGADGEARRAPASGIDVPEAPEYDSPSCGEVPHRRVTEAWLSHGGGGGAMG